MVIIPSVGLGKMEVELLVDLENNPVQVFTVVVFVAAFVQLLPLVKV